MNVLEIFFQRNFVADFIQWKLTFIPKNGKLGISTPHLGELGQRTTFVDGSLESAYATSYSL